MEEAGFLLGQRRKKRLILGAGIFGEQQCGKDIALGNLHL
jgi:hypothetical protein